MAVTLQPRVRRTAHNTQHTYNLSRRISSVQTYPVLSPQGATILLYAHEDGVTVVWRGGRRFKPEVEEAAQSGSQQNGNRPPQDSVMILDSDDEDEAPNGKAAEVFVDKPQFEDTIDEDTPYPEITQTLDLSFGTAIQHIATLPMSPCAAEDASWGGINLFKEKMVFAVSSASREVFLITLPLVPPSPLSKARKELRESLLAGRAGNGTWGETITPLTGQERSAQGLAMSLVQPSSLERSKSRERSQSTSRSGPRVVVAAHTKEALGTLRLWDIPLESQNQKIEPFQTEYLPRPLTAISFNPSQNTQLLCNFSPDAVRIYDYAQASMPQDDLSEGPLPSQGSWLISFYPPFTKPTSSRKPILAAQWICQGGAIFVLLADGQWGIWDIAGRSPQGSGLLRKNGAGAKGDALTDFSVTGYVEGTSPLRNPGAQRSSAASSEFVPMTPHTRREALTTAYGPERLVAVKGGVTVVPLSTSATTTPDESIILWIGGAESIFLITGVMKFWEAQSKKVPSGSGNLFGGAQPTRMLRLTDLGAGLMGERCTGASAIARSTKTSNPASSTTSIVQEGGLPVEVIIVGESRMVIVQESESTTGTKIGGVVARRSARAGQKLRDSSAIVVYPRPAQPSSVAYNLSSKPRNALSRGRIGGLFDKPEDTEKELALSKQASASVDEPKNRNQGFAFFGDLEAAADGQEEEDDEDLDESNMERNMELEILDIMEIDKELESLDMDRRGGGRGRKTVLFDS